VDSIYRHIFSKQSIKGRNDIIDIFGYSRNRQEAEAIAAWMTDVAKNFMIDY
jgi:hypothetical protein